MLWGLLSVLWVGINVLQLETQPLASYCEPAFSLRVNSPLSGPREVLHQVAS